MSKRRWTEKVNELAYSKKLHYASSVSDGSMPQSQVTVDKQVTESTILTSCDSPSMCPAHHDETKECIGVDFQDSLTSDAVASNSPRMCLTQCVQTAKPFSSGLSNTQTSDTVSSDSSGQAARQQLYAAAPDSPDLCLSQRAGVEISESPDLFGTNQDSFNDTDPLLAELDYEKLTDTAVSSSLQQTPVHQQTAPCIDQSSANISRAPNEAWPNTPPFARDRSPSLTSFHDKIKRRLLDNTTRFTSVANQRNTELKREEMIRQALRQAADLSEHLSSQPEIPASDTSFFGLPAKVKELLNRHRGITKLYDWQYECLSLPALRSHSNLIYSLPTSGGKTLVAEILILQELLLQKKDAIFILPFVSIVEEKVRGFSPFAVDLGFFVEEYAGSKGSFPPKKRRTKNTVFICTIEKANSLVNSLIEQERLSDTGLIIVDELHMLGEGGKRGAVLEMTLTKVMYKCSTIQLVGMSATLSNIRDIQTFLQAELYSSDFRPVVLKEYVKVEDTIYEIDHKALCPDEKMHFCRVVSNKYTPSQLSLDPDRLAALVLEVIPQYSCLVFCPTKKNCENVAELVCNFISRRMLNEKKEERKALVDALRYNCNGQICPVLKRTVPYGVAYHHSGLTLDERKLIEEAYSEGTLCMLACTSTLAAGVNLPAKRVILRSPYVASQFLTTSQYKQMSGRAGRAGIDTSGESILIVQNRDKSQVLDLVGGLCEPCYSSLLYENKNGISNLLLTTISLQITKDMTSVIEFLRNTLCYVQKQYFDLDVVALAKEGLQQLVDLKLVVQQKTDMMEVTKLGNAVRKGSIDLNYGPQLHRDLSEALNSLVLANHLHLLYLVTPYDMIPAITPDWRIYLNELGTLDETELKVCNLIGVTESYLVRKVSAQKIRKPVEENVLKRFYMALMLYNLWRQRSIWHVAIKFNQSRGFVQQLLSRTASFASCVNHFCEELDEFWPYKEMLPNFVKRLSYCVTMELIPLLEIPGVKIGRARQLYNAGYKTLQLLAYADPEQLVSAIEHLPRKAARQIVSSAQMLLQQQAEALVEEADNLLAVPTAITMETTETNNLF